MTMLIAFSILGSVGNFLTFCFYIQKKSTVPNIFIRTLAASDFITCAITIPLTIWMKNQDFRTESEALCRTSAFMRGSFVPFATLLMVPIAVDRYFSLCKPFAEGLSKKGANRIILAITFCSVIFGTVSLIINYVRPQFFVLPTNISNTSVGNSSYDDLIYPNRYRTYDFQTNISNISARNSSHHHLIYRKRYTICTFNEAAFGGFFMEIFKLVYLLLYGATVLITLVLYGVIYIHIIKWRMKRKKLFNKCSNLQRTCEIVETARYRNNANTPIEFHIPNNGGRQDERNESNYNLGGHGLNATRYNIKLAFMLFTVSFVFIIAYLPFCLIGLGVIRYNAYVYYIFYSYNVIHPVTYAILDEQIRKKFYLLCHTCHR